MRVLLLGGTGNLGSHLIPALVAHGHEVTAYVRSPDKLRSIIPASLLEKIAIYVGDGLNSEAIEDALRKHNCDAIVNAAHNFTGVLKKQDPKTIAAAALTAAVRVGQARGKPLRAWQTGGLGSLQYPSRDGKIQDYLPRFLSEHHRITEALCRSIPVTTLRWTLLCTALMYPLQPEICELEQPHRHNLTVAVGSPPDWQDYWIRWVPVVGFYLNLVLVIRSYDTYLEHVADMIAEQLEEGNESQFVGDLVGMKQKAKEKDV